MCSIGKICEEENSMDHKCLTFIRTSLVILVFAAFMGATPSAYAHDPPPQLDPDNIPGNALMDPAVDMVKGSSPMTEPLPTGESLAYPSFTLIPRDDRDNYMPTAWKILYHQTAEDVYNTIRGYRLVDIYVESISPHIFTGVYVANEASYEKTWWWYYGVDEDELNQRLDENNARLISLKAYDIGFGQIRFTAVMIENTGLDATAWWWYYNATVGDITDLIDKNEARLTQINAYETGGNVRYAVVMVDNTGDNGKAWWLYFNVSPTNVSTLVQMNNARLVDMDIDPDTGNLNVIMTSCASSCPYWWWFVNVPEAQLLNLVNQYGARVIDVNSHPGCGSTCFDVILINNSNAITTRVGEMLRTGTDGTKGLYLEEVGGSVLANLMNDYIFEPASSLKVGVHLHTILQIRDNPDVNHLTLIPAYPPLIPPDSCPDDPASGTESIFDADRKMMRYSDNATTRELVDFFGRSNINTTMASIGMTDSSINHVFGCGGPPANETTLDDLATLYRGVVNGSTINSYDRELFYLQMAGTYMYMQEGWDFTHLVDSAIPLIIDQEAPAGMPTALIDAFTENIFLAYKAGGYDLCGDVPCSYLVYHRSLFGYAEIPFCNAEGPHQYTFGFFIADATNIDNADDTFDAARAELLREQIRDGLASCFNQTHLPLIIH
jgi:hypothetical protein